MPYERNFASRLWWAVEPTGAARSCYTSDIWWETFSWAGTLPMNESISAALCSIIEEAAGSITGGPDDA